MKSNINELLQRINDNFEILDYVESFEIDNELTSLKISLINLLVAFDDDESKSNFFQITSLATPILFDFMYNDYIQKHNRFLKASYKKTKYYNQSKKWYKFVRNSLIHTNRYTHNLFTDKIYRIEYEQSINIYFELDKENAKRSFEKFLKNRFVQKNVNKLLEKNITPVLINNGSVRFSIDYDEFIEFIYSEIKLFIDLMEKDIDKLVMKEMNKWEEYYKFYNTLIHSIIENKIINVDDVIILINKIRSFKKFNNFEVVVLVEFLIYLLGKDIFLDSKNIDEIVKFSAIDIFSQINDRNDIFEDIVAQDVAVDIDINYEQIQNILFQIGIEDRSILKFMKNDKYTNYLIIFTRKYFKSKKLI